MVAANIGDSDMMARILALGEELAKRGEQDHVPASPQLRAEVVQLPVWSDAVRGVPNGFLRSALFGAIRKGRRRYLKGEPVAAIEGIQIVYTGERLDQYDLTVYETLLHLLREHRLGCVVRITAYEFLKIMAKADNGHNRKILHSSLMRLGATMVDVTIGSKSYAGSLVDEVFQDKDTREYLIGLNLKLRPFFDRDQYTLIDWQVRQALNGHQLAQWLHGFYSSHAKPLPIKVETLRQLCGCDVAESWKFTQTLRKALGALKQAYEVYGEKFSHEVQNGLVTVEKNPSASQQKHLINRSTKPKNRKVGDTDIAGR